MKTLLRWLVRLLFGFRVENARVLQAPGPVLLLPNHVSWLDWIFVGVCLDDDWKFVVSNRTAGTSWLHRKIMINRRTFPIDTLSPYSARHMAEYLQQGGRLVLFAEGRLSRTGALMKLFEGTGFLLHKARARVITCHLRGAHRIWCSPNHDTKQWFPRVSAHFSDLLSPPKLENATTSQARIQLTAWVRDAMQRQQFEVEMRLSSPSVPEAIVETARQSPARRALEDLQQAIPYRRLLTGARLLAGQLDRRLGAGETRVGVLLPNAVATPVTLLALWTLGRVPAVLNFSTGMATMLSCASLAGLKNVITSRAFLERARLNLSSLEQAGLHVLYLEDLRAAVSVGNKIAALSQVVLNPSGIIRTRSAPDDTAVILFTSGSEGVPKGVELSHRNLLANVRQMISVIDLQDHDRAFNALPLFHSFGLTVGTLLPLIRGFQCFLFPSPLLYRVVPTLFYDNDCTVLLGTNTFLNGYARRANPMDFRSLRYLIAAAEKLQESTAATWSARFGVRVLEGYGATECSPAVSVCTPMTPKAGSAGRFLPGIEYRLEPVEGVSDGGRLHVCGPNVMKGYLNPEANAKFLQAGGWYDTGDIARVDDEGFVFILGRLKRFAKISGEMISLTAVEDALAGAFRHYGARCEVAVVSRRDEDKGEALVAVSNEPRLTLDEIRTVLRAKGLPNLCVPREVKFLKELPKLGTGKIHHRELAAMI